ncbi:MAG: helix-turn-helix domain-containing protein [Candidatus Aminicenantes bacterium]|nr:helix-turn-helix domain-containing protein [Candidatus Aminicenantes bacterium]
MATLGQELREERERRTLSVKDVADRTKIASRILTALENDRWEEMPQKIFLKGVIKAYAQAIGADPALFLDKYEEQQKAHAETPEKDRGPLGRKKYEAPEEIMRESEKTPARRKIFRVFFVFLFLFLAAAAGYWFFLKPGRGPAPQVLPRETPAPLPAVSTPAVIAPEKEPPETAETGLRLEFRFNADCWMHIAADGVVILDGIKPAGSTATLRAEREFIIQTGNAGGFDFMLNGQPGRPLGGPGIVLTDIRINSDNAGTFFRKEKPPADDAAGR